MKKKLLFALMGTSVLFGLSAVALVGCGEEVAYGDWEVTVAATCETRGVETRVALDDPTKIQQREIPAMGHDYGEWEEQTAPTCLVAGVAVRACKTCENYDYQPIPALGHEWGAWEYAKAPTCTASGIEMRVCLHDDNHTDIRTAEALGHDWGDWVVTKAPACDVVGIETSYCRNCNDHTQTRKIAPLLHDWSDWVETKAPVGDTDGAAIRVCRNDKAHTETKAVLPDGYEAFDFVLNAEKTEYSISVNVFYRPKLSGKVNIPATYNGLPITEIRARGFYECSEVEEFVFSAESRLRKIGKEAFANCTRLASFDVPEGVTEVDKEQVFDGCSSLKSLSFPSTLTSIPVLHNKYDMFVSRTLEEVTVAPGNPVYRSEGSCIIERATNIVVSGTVYSVIPEGVTAIGAYAFYGVQREQVFIPASVLTIGEDAFSHNYSLTTLVFAEGSVLTEIGRAAFDYCANLEQVEFPASLVTIGIWAFHGSPLKNAHLPANVKKFDVLSFTASTMRTITVSPDNPYYYQSGDCIIERETHKLVSCATWESIPEEVTSIGKNAFYASVQEYIYIGKNIASVDDYAFAACVMRGTIHLLGFSSAEEADAVWGTAWREHCGSSKIVYGDITYTTDSVV